MPEKQTILVIDDEAHILELLEYNLVKNGYGVLRADTGEMGLELLKCRKADLVLLDYMLPGMDGFALCRRIRRDSDVPVIFITARVMEEDMLNGYSLGADDYVPKPFSLPVLYAKAMALTGRVRGRGKFLEAGRLRVDTKSRQVWRDGERLSLPPREYELLLFFLENPGRIFSRQQLLIRFWGYEFDGNERVVDNHIKKLRKALGSWGGSVQTVRGSGYRLEVDHEKT